MLVGRGQDPPEADHEQIADQMGVNILGSPAHILLFETADPFADGGFDFALCSHGNLEIVSIPNGEPARVIPVPTMD